MNAYLLYFVVIFSAISFAGCQSSALKKNETSGQILNLPASSSVLAEAQALRKTVSSFDQMLKAALEYSPLIKAEESKTSQISADVDGFWTYWVPQVGVKFSLPIWMTSGFSSAGANSTFASGWRVTLRQRLLTGLDEIVNYQKAKLNLSVSYYNKRVIADEVLRALIKNYFAMELLEKQMEIQKRIIQTLQQMSQTLAVRVRQGRNRNADLLQTQADLALARAEKESLISLHDKFKVATELACHCILNRQNSHDFMKLFLEEKKPENKIAEKIKAKEHPISNLSLFAAERPEIAMSQLAIELAEKDYQLALSLMLPRVYLEGNYRPDFTANKHEFYSALAIEAPLTQIFSTHYDLKKANSIIEQKKHLKRQSENDIISYLSDVINQYQATSAQDELYQKAYLAADTSYQAYLREYNLNLVTQVELLQATQKKFQMEKSWQNIRSEKLKNQLLLMVELSLL